MNGQRPIAPELMAAILEGTPDDLYVYDAGGRFLYVTPRGARLMGVSPEAMLGKTGRELGFPDAIMAPLDAARGRVLATGQTERQETRVETTEGWRHYEYILSPLHASDGNLVGVLSTVRDVTERVQLLATIRKERALLKATTEHMAEGLLLLEPNGCVRLANPQAAVLLGVPHEAIQAGTAHNLFGPGRSGLHDAERVWMAWQLAQRDIATRPRFNAAIEGPPHRDLILHLFPCPTGDEALIGVLIRDVTHERALDRAKDELVGMVSHELRTPLASVVGFSELLLTRTWSEAQQREFLETMLQEGRRLTTLINDFLDVQRLESGRMELHLGPVDLRSAVAQAATVAGDDPDRPIHIEIPTDLPLVLADPDRLQQVVLNLLSNARKYSPHGGTIHVTARSGQASSVEVSVRDQGLGLPREALPHLFERFYRVDSKDRREIGGTGLGLAITRQLVEAHGGSIRAESPGPGEGSTFVFTLPTADPVAVATERDSEVLIVEDDPVFARLLAEELRQRGFTASHAGSGEKALARLEANPARVVILDLVLPDLPGEAVLARLQAVRGQQPLPVVIVTVKDLDETERRALGPGVVTVLRKGPGIATAVALAVEQLLGERGSRPIPEVAPG